MSQSESSDRVAEPVKKKRKSGAPAGESDKWIKKESIQIWEFLHQKSVFNALMKLDAMGQRTFTIPSRIPVFQKLFLFCLSESALIKLDEDGGLQDCNLTDHEKFIKANWEKGEADDRLIGRKKSRLHKRAREHTVQIQNSVAATISKERDRHIEGYAADMDYNDPLIIPENDEDEEIDENDPQAANLMIHNTQHLDDYQVEEEVLIAEQPVGSAEPEFEATIEVQPTVSCSGCDRDLTLIDLAIVPVFCHGCHNDGTLKVTGPDENAELETELEDLASFPVVPNESRTNAVIINAFDNYAKIVSVCNALFEDLVAHLAYDPSTKFKCNKCRWQFQQQAVRGIKTMQDVIMHGYVHQSLPTDATHKRRWFRCPVCQKEVRNPAQHFKRGFGLTSCMAVNCLILGERVNTFYKKKYGIDLEF